MRKLKFYLSLLLILIYGHYLFGQKTNPKDVDYSNDNYPEDNTSTTPRSNDVVIPIVDINTVGWNTLVCLEDPDIDWGNLYGGAFDDKDVNKLRTIPYTNNNASGNPFISNHTFWFSFGCCGEAFCADDIESSYVYTDDFWDVGSLLMPSVNTDYPTSVWVDFLTQCENCTGAGESGTGIWHKWVEDFDEYELANKTSYPNGGFGASLEFMGAVPCDGFSTYGCQDSELD